MKETLQQIPFRDRIEILEVLVTRNNDKPFNLHELTFIKAICDSLEKDGVIEFRSDGSIVAINYKPLTGNLPCKYARQGFDSVPMPFGSGNCSMPSFECVYDGDIKIPDNLVCNEDKSCPAYSPVPTQICKRHGLEFWDVCPECEDEYWQMAESYAAIEDKEL